MILEFTKMHGCGNDYIYVDGFRQNLPDPSKAAIMLSKRHFSVGSDGLIMVCPSDCADAKMRMFNADGSEGKMCGNGIRCVAKFVYDNNICRSNPLKIETLSGIKTVYLSVSDGKVTAASVDMGCPVFTPSEIPVLSENNLPIINKEAFFGGNSYHITCVSMGNPHCVIFMPSTFDLWNFDIEKIGSVIENDNMFPEKVNTEFVKKIKDDVFEMRVWERGSGETYACGTGACAVTAAACKNGLVKMNTDVMIKLKGGSLIINYSESGIKMTGEAVTAFRGTAEI